MAVCAFEARTSCGASRLSKPIEAFISSMISAGKALKRPPHMRFADLSVTGLCSVSTLESPKEGT